MSTVSPGSTASLSSFCSVSPPPAPAWPAPEQREPLSLVVAKEQAATPTTATKHWKKSISRSYSSCPSPGPVSPSTSTTAEALLSLAQLPAPRVLPVAVAPTRPAQHRIVQPWATPAPAPSKPAALFPSHPLPPHPLHFRLEAAPAPALPQLPVQPAPLREVQANLQLTARPPFPVPSLAKVKQEPGWPAPAPAQLPPPAAAPLFRHSVFTSENLEEGSGARDGRDKPLHCRECKKSFSTQSGFAKHQQLHCSNQIQRETTCKYCNKAYNSTSALKMHIRTHTLPCKCDQCGKSFSRPWLLQGHLRTHTGEKPFACTECARTFADKSNLRAHLQTHLQNKKYSCPGCQKTFSRMSLLTKHTDSGCLGLQSRNDECVETLTMMSSGLLRS